MREGRNRLLWGTLCLSLLVLILLTVPLWSNGGKEKTAKEWLEELYGEPFDEFSPDEGEELPERAPEGSLEAKLEIDHPPQLGGHTAHITFTITSHWDFPGVEIVLVLSRERDVDREAGIECVSVPEGFETAKGPGTHSHLLRCPLKKGEIRTFEFDIRLTNEGVKCIRGFAGGIPKGRPLATDNIYLDVSKEETKVSKTGFPDPPEYWLTPLFQEAGPIGGVEKMREDMERFIKEAPGVTAWEARWLVDKAEYMGSEQFQRVYSRRKEPPPGWVEIRRMMIEKIIRDAKKTARTMKTTVLEVLRSIVSDWKRNRPKEEWIVPENMDIDEEGLKGNGSTGGPFSVNWVRVRGYFKYLDHRYDKDQGLLPGTDTKPMTKALVCMWEHYGAQRYLIGKNPTDDNGYYDFLGTVVDTTQNWHSIFTVVVTTGPHYQFPQAYKVRVQSDTVSQYPEWPIAPWWRDWSGVIDTVAAGDTVDRGTYYFGERWGLYPNRHQPRSGAANVYDNLLRGYEYVVDTLGLSFPLYLIAVWEPGYQRGSWYCVGDDSIEIYGADNYDTDEWDDGVILHEFGHFVMDEYAELRAGVDPAWPYDYSPPRYARRYLRDAWQEAWAYLFSSVVRHDTFFVDTRWGINPWQQPKIWSYYNLENEDDFWYDASPRVCPDTMQGGPGCIDAIAASLWDFCDATNENWPDGLQDSLNLHFTEIWDVFDNYDPAPPAGNEQDHCWNISQFWAGWLARGHNYATRVKRIFWHHGIAGMEAYCFQATGGDRKVDLDWRANDFSESSSKSLNIFNIYRSDYEFGPYALRDSSYHVPGETLYSYSDTTVEYAMPYWYRVGAVDSIGLEAFSESDSGIPYNLPPPPAPPGSVTSLTAVDTPFDEGGSITLTWVKSPDDSVVVSYYVFRSWIPDSGYACIDSVGAGVETYEDTLAVDGDTLYYMVRAHNGTNGSNSEEAWAVSRPNRVGTSDTDLATAFNNARKIAADSANVHVVFQSEGQIWYSVCNAHGGDWSTPLSLGEGKTPSLDLDMQADPHVVWVGPEESQATWLYYARYDGAWDVDSLLFVTSNTRPYLPSFQVDDSAYGHIVWEEHAWKAETPVLVNYAVFKTQNPDSISVENIDAMFGNGWFCSPSIALDDSGQSNRPHVVWRKYDPGRIYYAVRDSTWSSPDTVSSLLLTNNEQPCLDFFGDKVAAVWMAKTAIVTPPDIFYRSRELSQPWDTVENVTQSEHFSAFPVIVAGIYAVWAESLTTGPSHESGIFGARRKEDGTWEQLGELSSTPGGNSRFPQAAFWQDADTGYLYVARTEGNSAPYTVMVNRFEVPRVPGWTERIEAGVEEGLSLIPRVFGLCQNYPNPFTRETRIAYSVWHIAETGGAMGHEPLAVSLRVYDLRGRLVRTLVDEEAKVGRYTATWDGRDSLNRVVASGVYFYRLTAGHPNDGEAREFTATQRMVLVR